MATEDGRYRESTQYQFWSFTTAELGRLREQTNSSARATLSERLAQQLTNRSGPNSSANTAERQNGGLPDFLTPAEEALLLNFYCHNLLQAAEHLRLVPETRATAGVLLRRFYTTNSIMTYPPTDMMLVALFFGCKAEGDFRNVKQFVRDINIDEKKRDKTADDILAGEFLLCQGVRFHFDVRHPYRALEGAIMALRRHRDLDDARIVRARARARDILKWTPHFTDAYFHYTPSQMMLAALSLADRGLAERLLHDTFHHDAARPLPPAVEQERMAAAIARCRDMLGGGGAGLGPDLPAPGADFAAHYQAHWEAAYKARVAPLVQKLKKCRDPDRKNFAALERARRELAMREAASDDEEEEEEGGAAGDGGGVDQDAAVFGGPSTKRRKVAVEDPFGPAL